MSGTALKWIAVAAMILDHIAAYIPSAPFFLHWIGRLAAPLFMFCFAFSMQYTHDRTKFLVRLYVLSLIMGLVNFFVYLFYRSPYEIMTNNFFATLFLIGMCIVILEMIRDDPAFGKRLLWVFAVFDGVSALICFMAGFVQPQLRLDLLIQGLVPNVFDTEGGILIVLFGVLLYWFRKERKWLCGVYAAMCAAYAVIVWIQAGFSWTALLFDDYQWMMVAAVPLFYLYNGQRGKGYKYFFYVFYPVHIWILFVLGNCIQ